MVTGYGRPRALASNNGIFYLLVNWVELNSVSYFLVNWVELNSVLFSFEHFLASQNLIFNQIAYYLSLNH